MLFLIAADSYPEPPKSLVGTSMANLMRVACRPFHQAWAQSLPFTHRDRESLPPMQTPLCWPADSILSQEAEGLSVSVTEHWQGLVVNMASHYTLPPTTHLLCMSGPAKPVCTKLYLPPQLPCRPHSTLLSIFLAISKVSRAQIVTQRSCSKGPLKVEAHSHRVGVESRAAHHYYHCPDLSIFSTEWGHRDLCVQVAYGPLSLSLCETNYSSQCGFRVSALLAEWRRGSLQHRQERVLAVPVADFSTAAAFSMRSHPWSVIPWGVC